MANDSRPLVLHVVHRFDTGGLENGVVNLVNRMPFAAYRHAVLALTEVTEFRHRITRDDVGFFALRKRHGQGARAFPAMSQMLRDLRPQVMHTRNLGPLEMQLVGGWKRVTLRVHGEHGRELNDLTGDNRRLQWVRRAYTPFVHRYIALSQDLERYLVDRVGIGQGRIRQIYNGVDADRFQPAGGGPVAIPGCPFDPQRHWLVGTVGRMQSVKHQVLLAHAFVRAQAQHPAAPSKLRLVMVGDGPLRQQCVQILEAAGVADLAWLPGERADVPDVMRGLSCFVLPSLAEGISNTILEAMASGLPVIATRVGGSAELLHHGHTGWLVPTDDAAAMANALVQLFAAPEQAIDAGRAGRRDVEQRFSMQAMVAAYQKIYEEHRSRLTH